MAVAEGQVQWDAESTRFAVFFGWCRRTRLVFLSRHMTAPDLVATWENTVQRVVPANRHPRRIRIFAPVTVIEPSQLRLGDILAEGRRRVIGSPISLARGSVRVVVASADSFVLAHARHRDRSSQQADGRATRRLVRRAGPRSGTERPRAGTSWSHRLRRAGPRSGAEPEPREASWSHRPRPAGPRPRPCAFSAASR